MKKKAMEFKPIIYIILGLIFFFVFVKYFLAPTGALNKVAGVMEDIAGGIFNKKNNEDPKELTVTDKIKREFSDHISNIKDCVPANEVKLEDNFVIRANKVGEKTFVELIKVEGRWIGEDKEFIIDSLAIDKKICMSNNCQNIQNEKECIKNSNCKWGGGIAWWGEKCF